MKKLFPFFVIATFILTSSSDIPLTTKTYLYNYENVLGTSFSLKVSATNEENAERAERAALMEIDRLEDILSSYDPDSEVSRWQKSDNTDVKVSKELFEVLSLFEQWEIKTDGALNAAAAVGSVLWKKAADMNELPDQEELSSAVSAMSKTHWALNEEEHTAMRLSAEPLVFNSFVKSYIISKASEVVMDLPGIKSAVINIGGDIVTAGISPEKIEVADPAADAENAEPLATLQVSDMAVATSGNYRRGFNVGNEWFSHIIDPRTALPAGEVISATVVAENATDAGALATSFNILSPEESRLLAKEIPGAEYLIITRDGKRIKSEGWDRLDTGTDYKLSSSTAEAAADYELVIEFEITRFQGRSPRPYIAVWVENEKAEPVKTVALWFNNYRWLPDLRRWYTKHIDKTQQYDFMQTVTSATRSAGKYTLTWDGKDAEGNSLKSGEYTVFIEASREHGTYQLIKKEIELNKKPQRIDLEGGVEVSSAALEYRKVEKNKPAL